MMQLLSRLLIYKINSRRLCTHLCPHGALQPGLSWLLQGQAFHPSTLIQVFVVLHHLIPLKLTVSPRQFQPQT